MTAEPSDIINLPRVLSYDEGDWTCQNLYDRAVRQGLPILEVCHEAALMLA